MLSLLSFFYYPYFLFTPPTHEYFFCEGLIFFWCLVARGCENFKFLGDLLYWGYLVSSLGKEEWAIFFHKAINNQSCKLKNSWWQKYFSCVYANFSHFYLGIFCLFQFSLKLSKKCVLLFGNNSESVNTVWYELWKSIWFCSCSLKRLVLCHMNCRCKLWKYVQYCLHVTLKISVLFDMNSGKVCSTISQ